MFKRLTTNFRRHRRCEQKTAVDFEGEVNLFHFELLRIIGKGTYGRVRVVEHKKTGDLYALKYIDKARCVKSQATANIVQERILLEEIHHPFIVNMYYAFQGVQRPAWCFPLVCLLIAFGVDAINCYFILDLMLGGDLRCELSCCNTMFRCLIP